MLDSTEVPVIEAGLKLCSGKAIINSINLEDGRKTLDPKTILAKKYGAALVALTIDEKGQADTAEWKFEVAKRIYDIVVHEYGIPPTDLLFDPLVFPVSTGQEQTRKSAIATFEAIRLIKQNLPGALTHVGLSNCSLRPDAVHAAGAEQRVPALRAGVRPRLGDSARGQDHAARQHRRHGQGTVPPVAVRRAGVRRRRRTAPKTRCNCSSSTTRTRRPRRKKGQSLGDTVEERLRQAIIQGRREIADRGPRRGPRTLLAHRHHQQASCSTA